MAQESNSRGLNDMFAECSMNVLRLISLESSLSAEV